jgi:putative ABC transport system permease protein
MVSTVMKQFLRFSKFTAVAVLTLAPSIGANTPVFSVVQKCPAARPLPYHHPEQLVEIANSYFPQVPKAGPTPGDYFDWRPQNASFSELGAFTKTLQGFDLLGDGESRRTQ